jgi:hypothetical protein
VKLADLAKFKNTAMSNYKRKGSPSSQADRVTLPRQLEALTISLAPFTANGKTFRVIGTETERMECRFDTNGLPEIVTVKEHRHRVLCVETDERWWMPHERVKLKFSNTVK